MVITVGQTVEDNTITVLVSKEEVNCHYIYPTNPEPPQPHGSLAMVRILKYFTKTHTLTAFGAVGERVVLGKGT